MIRLLVLEQPRVLQERGRPDASGRGLGAARPQGRPAAPWQVRRQVRVGPAAGRQLDEAAAGATLRRSPSRLRGEEP